MCVVQDQVFFCRTSVVLKMNYMTLQQNAPVAGEEMRAFASICTPRNPVVCPKPRRMGIFRSNQTKPSAFQLSHQSELYDSVAGAELLDIILKREGFVATEAVPSSPPPFFCGSPPGRAANPLTQDARFGDERITGMPILSPSGISSPPSSIKVGGGGGGGGGGGCAKMKFGFKQAEVRVEGFDCLNRDRQNSSIPAVA